MKFSRGFYFRELCELNHSYDDLNMRWRQISQQISLLGVYSFSSWCNTCTFLTCKLKKEALVPFLNDFSCWKCVDNGCLGTMKSLLIGLLYATLWENCENKNSRNVCLSLHVIRENISPWKFLLIQYMFSKVYHGQNTSDEVKNVNSIFSSNALISLDTQRFPYVTRYSKRYLKSAPTCVWFPINN